MKLNSVMQDAGIESGIIVCKSGFTKDTLTYAKHMGIMLVELWEAKESNATDNGLIEIGTLEIHNHVMIRHTIVTIVDFGSIAITGERELWRCITPIYRIHMAGNSLSAGL